MHILHLMHVLRMLTYGYGHIHGTGALFRYYLHHHAVAFLRSGVTSESPSVRAQALQLLHWLTVRHIAPADW
jgi:hypothetical protein